MTNSSDQRPTRRLRDMDEDFGGDGSGERVAQFLTNLRARGISTRAMAAEINHLMGTDYSREKVRRALRDLEAWGR